MRTDRQTNGQTDVAKPTVVLCERALKLGKKEKKISEVLKISNIQAADSNKVIVNLFL